MGYRPGRHYKLPIRGLPATPVSSWLNFTPLSLPGLVAWWDASDTSTITASSNQVSEWRDKSGNNRHLSQSSSSFQPKSGLSTLNNRNVLLYDGANTQFVQNTSVPTSGAVYYYFAVYELPTDSSYVLATTSSNNGVYIGAAQSGSISTLVSIGTLSFSIHINQQLFSGTTRQDLYASVGTAPVLIRIRGNQSVEDGLNVGYGGGGGFRFSNNTKVAEIIFTRDLPNGMVLPVEQYLKAKWGL